MSDRFIVLASNERRYELCERQTEHQGRVFYQVIARFDDGRIADRTRQMLMSATTEASS